MFLIYALFYAAVGGPRKAPPLPTDYTVVETIGRIPRDRQHPPSLYVKVALPVSALHYALVDSATGLITDYLSNPIP